MERAFLVVPTQAVVSQFIGTFKDFPPRQRPSSFSVDDIMEVLKKPTGGSEHDEGRRPAKRGQLSSGSRCTDHAHRQMKRTAHDR